MDSFVTALSGDGCQHPRQVDEDGRLMPCAQPVCDRAVPGYRLVMPTLTPFGFTERTYERLAARAKDSKYDQWFWVEVLP